MKKGIKKQHIINDSNSYCCGLNRNNVNVKSAFYFEDVLYLNDSTEVNHSNYELICRNCLKLCHPTLFNDLLNEKELIEYKKSLPKSNRERFNRNANKRNERIEKRLNQYDNVIYLGMNESLPDKPIMNPAQLLPMPESIIELSDEIQVQSDELITASQVESIETEIDYEESFIEFTDGIALIRGFGNQWSVVFNDNGSTESLSHFMPYEEAMNEVKGLLAVNQ